MREPTSNEVRAIEALGKNTIEWLSNRNGRPITQFNLTSSATFSWNHFRPNGSTSGWGTCLVNEPFEVRFFTDGSDNYQLACKFVKETDEWWPFPDFNPRMPDNLCTQGLSGQETASNDDYWNQRTGYVYTGLARTGTGSVVWKNYMYKLFYGKNATNVTYNYPTIPYSNVVGTGGQVFIAFPKTGAPGSDVKGITGSQNVIMNSPSGVGWSATMITADADVQYKYPGNVVMTLANGEPTYHHNGAPRQVAPDVVAPGRTSYTTQCGQPLQTSRYFMSNPVDIAEDAMLIFRLSSPTHSFEVGVNAFGYLITGGSKDSGIIPNDGYDITFAGFGNHQTRLVGPVVAPSLLK